MEDVSQNHLYVIGIMTVETIQMRLDAHVGGPQCFFISLKHDYFIIGNNNVWTLHMEPKLVGFNNVS
jgi:hypothetical protein